MPKGQIQSFMVSFPSNFNHFIQSSAARAHSSALLLYRKIVSFSTRLLRRLCHIPFPAIPVFHASGAESGFPGVRPENNLPSRH